MAYLSFIFDTLTLQAYTIFKSSRQTARFMDPLDKAILHKLLRHGYVGAKHTALENLPKGFPKHLHKELMKKTEKLVKKGFITPKPTGYGMQVSLNPHKMADIEGIIKDP
jgi:hypothetical protein